MSSLPGGARPWAPAAARVPTFIVLAVLLKSAWLRHAESDYSTGFEGVVNWETKQKRKYCI
jgi:hypothetical protein